MATVDVISPFQVLTRPLTLKPKDRKPPALGPAVGIAAVRASPASGEADLPALANVAGLRDIDKDGLLEQDTVRSNMWLGSWTADLRLEFDLSEAGPLAAIEVWNFNGNWQTTNGLRKADIAVSPDGTSWQTVVRGAEFAEADGIADYDEPTVLKLNGVTARKVRLENLVPWSNSGQVGLSKVIFHGPAGTASAKR